MAKRKKAHSRSKGTLADRADVLALYQQSVQSPQYDIDLFVDWFRKLRGRKPLVLREDFCGTAYTATEWVRGSAKRSAIGVDLDEPTLEWGRRHVLGKEKPSVQKRVKLIHGNVLDVTKPKADLTCAMNFSYCVFKTREQLTEYFRAAHRGLKRDGVFACELYGGTEAIVPCKEKRKVGRFQYVWEQAEYNPITNETLCHIHFRFRDGSRIDRAFTYDWRLWTIPEVKECLLDAGFRLVDVYWEDEDEKGEGTGSYRVATKEENVLTWLVYFVAAK